MPINGLSMIKRIAGLVLLAGLVAGTAAFAQAPANAGIVVTESSGTVRYRIGDSEPRLLAKGQAVPLGARIVTGTDSHVVLSFPDGQVVVLGPQSRLLIREFVYLPTDLAKSRVLLNLTDGSIYMVMGAIGQRDPALIQIQVGTKITAQSPRRARGNDAGVIVLGTATLVQVAQGRVSLLVASSDQSYSLIAGTRAVVQADGTVRMGPPSQVDEQAGRDADGRFMLGRMEILRRYLPPAGRQIAFFLTTPPSDETLEELLTGTLPTLGTGATAGGCGASCN